MENETINESATKFEGIITTVVEYITTYGIKFLGAVLVLIIGLWIVKVLKRSFRKMMVKSNIDDSLVPFLSSIVGVILKLLVVISVLGMVGIEMTSFIAILGAAGLAVGMALSGTLQNFAGGVMILIFKPFKMGDYIETQGYAGSVKEIRIFNTILETVDGQTIILPNAPVSTSPIVNKSTKPIRRVDLTIGIGYNDDIDKTREVLRELAEADSRVLKDPDYDILVSALADSSVNFSFRLWVNSPDYWGVYFGMHEAVKKALDKNGISIPYPQTDVHVYKMD
ncbi:MAG: mechanosensitive ion channel [Cyclobacteriaceae bacterium]|nr:mechanosensitive ion channel [Cyclobacteriaceae bacterium]